MNLLTVIIKYCRERFPVLPALSFSIVFCLVVFYYLSMTIDYLSLLLGISLFFLFFFRLRLIDEIKDFQYDKDNYSQRPVSRGLITIKQIKFWLLIVIILESALVASQSGVTKIIFFIILAYAILMFFDFFIPRFEKYLLAFLLSHQLIFLLYILLEASIALNRWWWPQTMSDASFVTILFVSPMIYELGRKSYPRFDNHGTETADTYFSRWGLQKTSFLIIVLLLIQILCLMFILKSYYWMILIPALYLIVLIFRKNKFNVPKFLYTHAMSLAFLSLLILIIYLLLNYARQ